ncbi:DUF6292 family protein [Saccharothrix syringae]|uniref:DUF6292 domain-containing protein n=1 Tax=Saccharothrix syringae TaxID=103733 RepID=A0A5Q0GUY4_SACSY|nr:DUF6292 family protein [Saccharothrix syringae]QFZ17916.1 hypothetical protein EKG83_10865 [Saccharothrix syringae]
MDWEFDENVIRALRAYVLRVTRALGLSGESSYVQEDTAYLALDGRLPGFPDRDVALLWDAERGWALALESDSSEPPFVVARMRDRVRPEPIAVARWVEGLELMTDKAVAAGDEMLAAS